MQASDEQGGNRGLLKAELENVFGKPQPKVAGSRRSSSYILFITIYGGHFLWSLHQKKKTSFKLMKIALLILVRFLE